MRRFLIAALFLSGTALSQDPTPTPEPAPRTDPGTTVGGDSGTDAAPLPDAATLALLGKSYNGLTFDELEAIIKADGYGYERFDGTNGPYIQTGTANGVSYEVWLSECSQDPVPRCVGLTAQTFYFKESPKVTLKALNDWNANSWGVRAMLFGDGQSAMVMNVGVNGGVTGDWVVKRLRNFNYWAEAYSAFWGSGDPKATPAQ